MPLFIIVFLAIAAIMAIYFLFKLKSSNRTPAQSKILLKELLEKLGLDLPPELEKLQLKIKPVR